MGCMHPHPEAVVFTVAGTLADTSAISYLVAGHHPSCDAPRADRFQLESVLCPPVQRITRLLHLERRIGRKIIIITEARDHYRHHLQSWLDLHGITVDRIHLRQVSDHRPDALTKGEMMSRVQNEFNVVHAYESRADVARAYERLGVPVTLTGTTAAAVRSRAA